jgi:FkbM family methyltransferase
MIILSTLGRILPVPVKNAIKKTPIGDLVHYIHTHEKIRELEAKGLLEIKQDCFEIHFNEDKLDGQKILFPRRNGIDSIYRVPNDLPGYFQNFDIEEGEVVIDGGAFPGDFSVVASRKVGRQGRVFAFEPDKENRLYTHNVLEQNFAESVYLTREALSSSNGTGYMLPKGVGSKLVKEGSESNKVRTGSLDGLLANLGVFNSDRPLFVKLDIEGAELDVLADCPRTIEHGKKYGLKLAVASYHKVNGKPTHIELTQLMKYKYDCKHVSVGYEPHLTLYTRF